MGDVALTAPVLKGIREQYPEIEVVLLTRPAFKTFFYSIKGLRLFFSDFNKKHSGLFGLFRLHSEIINQHKIDYVLDLHDVLRSKILRLLFRISGVAVAVIDKGRRERRLLVKGKSRTVLKHYVERYCDVFTRAGFPLVPAPGPWIIPSAGALEEAAAMAYSKGVINIGVAPFAKYGLKIWPEEYMIKLLLLLTEKFNARLWLFGGVEESGRMEVIHSRIPGSQNLVDKFNLDEELAIMSELDFMVAMDSANMHMAAMVGTKVISIWGGTSPLGGFSAWIQPENYSIGIPAEELSCRPCTTYGNGKCRRGDFACMMQLTPEKVFNKIKEIIIPDFSK